MSKPELDGKVTIITGGGRGIGFATVDLFLENGAKVIVADLNVEEARKTFGQYGSERVIFIVTDVTKEDSVETMCKEALAHFGQVDACVMVAGVLAAAKSWIETDVADFDFTNTINLRGSWLTTKHAVKAMLASPHKGKGGSLVFISSASGLMGNPQLSSYCASKWGVRGLSLVASQEFAVHGIRSNVVQPGLTHTPLMDSLPTDIFEELKNGNALKRAAQPKEIAEAILFLSSEKSAYTTGASLAVHAGQCPT